MVAACGPAERSTMIVTSLGRRSTLDRSSPTQPFRQTQTPLIVTLSRSASKAASVVPTAASTRPQFASSPAMAHLSKAFAVEVVGAPGDDNVVLAGRADDLDRERLARA